MIGKENLVWLPVRFSWFLDRNNGQQAALILIQRKNEA